MGDRAVPIREHVASAPYQPGDRVLVIDAIDVEAHDVEPFVGMTGRVEYLEFSCGCGQSYPGDPMIGVVFHDGAREEFWKNELEMAHAR